MVVTDALRAGDAALERGEWAVARGAFEDARAAGGGPEADEGLASAAWFLDEAAVALEARERAYAGYCDAGRPVDAARIATALAWDYRIFRGEAAVGDGWLARARRLLRDAPPVAEQGWLALREASFALPQDVERARQRCAEAEALGRQLDDLDLEMTAVALDGLAQVSLGRIADGMARLDEAGAAATAGEMRDPVAIGLSCCYLIFACERVRDFDRAGQWSERLARESQRYNNLPLAALCRAHYGTLLVLRGEWARAEAELTAAAAGMAARPGHVGEALARLAELRRRQGRQEEAAALVEQAESQPLAALTAAALALDRGVPAEAVERAEQFLRMIPGLETERAPALELLAEAHAARGDAAAASAAARELRAIAGRAGTEALLGAASLGEGRALAAGGDGAAARGALEDAVVLLDRARLPFERARARLALAGCLRESRHDDAARSQAARARDELAALGADAEQRRAAAFLAGGAGGLTAREREVLALVALGRTNAQIAEALVLSEHTVHRHVANILAKLAVPTRGAAVARAGELGLL